MGRIRFGVFRCARGAGAFACAGALLLAAACAPASDRAASSSETEFYRQSRDIALEEPADADSGLVLLRGSGTIVEVDPGAMTARIAMDESSDSLAGQEALLGFRGHTQTETVDIGDAVVGDEVDVVFFNVPDETGCYNGESLVLAR